jgi:hypothetical protein
MFSQSLLEQPVYRVLTQKDVSSHGTTILLPTAPYSYLARLTALKVTTMHCGALQVPANCLEYLCDESGDNHAPVRAISFAGFHDSVYQLLPENQTGRKADTNKVRDSLTSGEMSNLPSSLSWKMSHAEKLVQASLSGGFPEGIGFY